MSVRAGKVYFSLVGQFMCLKVSIIVKCLLTCITLICKTNIFQHNIPRLVNFGSIYFYSKCDFFTIIFNKLTVRNFSDWTLKQSGKNTFSMLPLGFLHLYFIFISSKRVSLIPLNKSFLKVDSLFWTKFSFEVDL